MAIQAGPRVKLPFPVSADKIVQLCIEKDGLTRDERQYWWPVLVRFKEGEAVQTYPSSQIAVVKLTTAAKSVKFEPKRGGSNFTMLEAFNVLLRVHKVKDPKYLRQIYKLVATEIESHPYGCALVYNIFDYILKNKSKFGEFSAKSLRVIEATFIKIAEKTIRNTASALKQLRGFDDVHLNLIFFQFFKNILPDKYVMRIVDAYLLEGTKALYRYAIGFINEQKHIIKAPGSFNSGFGFWNLMKRRKSKVFEDCWEKIHGTAYEHELKKSLFKSSKFLISQEIIYDLTMEARKEMKKTTTNEFDIDDLEPDVESGSQDILDQHSEDHVFEDYESIATSEGFMEIKSPLGHSKDLEDEEIFAPTTSYAVPVVEKKTGYCFCCM